MKFARTKHGDKRQKRIFSIAHDCTLTYWDADEKEGELLLRYSISEKDVITPNFLGFEFQQPLLKSVFPALS